MEASEEGNVEFQAMKHAPEATDTEIVKYILIFPMRAAQTWE